MGVLKSSNGNSSVEKCVCCVHTVSTSGSFEVGNCLGKAVERTDFWILAG